MRCPICKRNNDRVLDIRRRKTGKIYRRRECMSCGHRFSTKEVIWARNEQRDRINSLRILQKIKDERRLKNEPVW